MSEAATRALTAKRVEAGTRMQTYLGAVAFAAGTATLIGLTFGLPAIAGLAVAPLLAGGTLAIGTAHMDGRPV